MRTSSLDLSDMNGFAEAVRSTLSRSLNQSLINLVPEQDGHRLRARALASRRWNPWRQADLFLGTRRSGLRPGRLGRSSPS